jgi:hypothetical protein
VKYVNDLIVANEAHARFINETVNKSNMELVNLRDGDPKYIKNGPVHLWDNVVTATHTENQGVQK